MADKIAKKLHKPKNELLINKIDSYRAKKEVEELVSKYQDVSYSDKFAW